MSAAPQPEVISERTPRPVRKRGLLARIFRTGVLLLILAVLGWTAWVYHGIKSTAQIDNAQTADAIAVFGAAEYAGRPSPVLHARLDKAVALYNRGIAPVIITLGGGGDRDSGKTEGGVGRDYLLANGVPYDRIVAETTSVDTEQQVQRLAEIARRDHLQRIVVVSDGTHLFRIALLCRRAGLEVYTSPRAPLGHIDELDSAQRMMHEILSYTSVRLGLHFSWLHRWLEGKSGQPG
jgi:uncharacterized SAM-binding protein YcdF (DUF218 family)